MLTALTETGGLPGLDAFDTIHVFRKGQQNRELTRKLQTLEADESPIQLVSDEVQVIQIPTRWPPNEPLPFGPDDVVLQSGDVVFLEARNADLFYTGGLLPSGEYEIPRDYDLDVLEAVVQVQGSLLNGAFGGNNLSGGLIARGMGNPSPSLLTVIRRTPGGGQIPIKVDLNRAMRDPRERILVRPGDLLVLQQTPGEAIANYFSNVVNFSIFGRVIQRGSLDGIITATVQNPQ